MDKRNKELTLLFGKLDEDRQQQLLEFARFLVERHPQQEIIISEPGKIERPEEESVVGAMKRLSRTYPMLDKQHLFNEASALMGEHMLQGREAAGVIDELEAVFLRHYTKIKES
ncbi:MAG TPA: Crp/Fnr family transcriptional regulator [Gammaproteobacteria bacterium]|nr:Crp/Fnr family transcriptional regulator [Gammaproteobacteria bacterium]